MSPISPIRTTTRIAHVEQVMGMAVSFTVASDDPVARTAIDDAVTWFHHVDDTFSTYKADSPITRFSRGELRVEELGDEIMGVLDLCDEACAATGGAFDAHAVQAPNGTSFDPSGLVKGWSVERAAAILERHGIDDFTINAGGDIVQRGGTWRTGIRHPAQPAKLAAVLEAEGPLAIATSAAYERNQHIVDPRTGHPAEALRSITVVGPDLTQADVWATALFVLGLDGLASLPAGYDAFAVTTAEQALSTPGFGRYRAPSA